MQAKHWSTQDKSISKAKCILLRQCLLDRKMVEAVFRMVKNARH